MRAARNLARLRMAALLAIILIPAVRCTAPVPRTPAPTAKLAADSIGAAKYQAIKGE